MYDFNSIVDRSYTGAVKIDFAPEPVKGSGFVPLTIADQEFRVAPEIQDSIMKAAKHGIYGYTYGDAEYRNAVNSWMLRRHSWDVSTLNMFVTNGVVPALGISVRAFTAPGEGVIIQPPVYPPFARAVRQNDRVLVENPLIYNDGFYTIDFEDLEAKCADPNTRMLILCSPHNPTGRVWSHDELARIGEICIRHNIIVLSDEIHNDLIMPGNSHTVFATVDGMADRCIVCTSPSKTFNLAGLCCSNIFIANSELASRFETVLKRESASHVPYFARAATIGAYNQSEGWLDELLIQLAKNFDIMHSFIQERLPMLKVTKTQGTYLSWVDMRKLGLDDKQLESLMLSHHLALDEGYEFGTNGSGFERWNLALPNKLLLDSLYRLEAAVKSLKA